MGKSRTSVFFFYALLGITSLLLLWLCSSFLGPIVLALVLFVLFQGLNQKLVDILKNRRRLASLITTVMIVLLVVIPLCVMFLLLATQAHTFYLKTRDSEIIGEIFGILQGKSVLPEKISEFFAEFGFDFKPDALAKIAADALTKIAFFFSDRVGNLANFASDIIGVALNFCVMVTVCYALFVHGSQIRNFIKGISPLPGEEENAIFERFKQISRTVFIGNGVASLIQGTLVGVLFSLFDAGPGILFGTASSILAFLPIVGSSIVFIPAAVVLCFTGTVKSAVLFLALNIAVSIAVEYWLKSKLIGGEEMNPVVAFLAIIAGIQLFGLMGLFYGPLIVTMFMAFIDIYQTRYRTVIRGPDGEERVELTPVPLGGLAAKEKISMGPMSVGATSSPPNSAGAPPAQNFGEQNNSVIPVIPASKTRENVSAEKAVGSI